jgi:hypothetical protein
MKVELSPQAQKDVRRFGWNKAFLLTAELRDLVDDPRLVSRLRPLLSADGRAIFRIDLTPPFVARVQITPEGGLLVERVVTTSELDATGDDFFGDA